MIDVTDGFRYSFEQAFSIFQSNVTNEVFSRKIGHVPAVLRPEDCSSLIELADYIESCSDAIREFVQDYG
jgi:hypothetical protein